MVLGSLASLGLGACSQSAQGAGKATGDRSAEEGPALVRVAPVAEQQVQRQVETTGYLEAEFRVVVQSEVAGRILEVRVDEGDRVEKDKTLLVQLDDREVKAAHAQLVVQKEAAALDERAKALTIRSAEREVQRAIIEKNKTRAELDRNLEIAQGIVSGKVIDDARFAWETAVEAEQVATLALDSARLEAERATNAVKELTSRVAEAQLRVDRHKVLAPLTGIVAKRHVTGGEIIGASTELFEVLDPDHLVAYVSQPQRNLSLVRGAKTVIFTTDTWPGEEFTADVETMATTVDRESGSFTLRVRVRPQDAKRLLPGMFFKARILAEDLRTALMVPKRAVLNNGDVSIVYAIRDGKAHEVDLDPGLERDEWIECRNRGDSGLHPDDLVVVSGQDDLRDQQPVEISEDSQLVDPQAGDPQPEATNPDELEPGGSKADGLKAGSPSASEPKTAGR